MVVHVELEPAAGKLGGHTFRLHQHLPERVCRAPRAWELEGEPDNGEGLESPARLGHGSKGRVKRYLRGCVDVKGP